MNDDEIVSVLANIVGADRAKRDLKVLKGRSDVVSLLKAKGLAEVVNQLNSLLPPLLTAGIFVLPRRSQRQLLDETVNRESNPFPGEDSYDAKE